MTQALIITLREGLEAALIVSIVLAYLVRVGQRSLFTAVWVGTLGAAVGSLATGAIMFSIGAQLEGMAEQLFEGAAMFLAVVILTWMIVWMKRQARDIRSHLEAQVQSAVAKGSSTTLAMLAFLAVGREGLETVLFLFAVVKTSTPLQSATGGLLGLGIAISLGYLIYKGSRRLNLRTFFNITGVLLILFAAGLLARGIHEFQEAGVLPFIIEHIWDINPILHEKSLAGSFLNGILGYNGNPSLPEVLAYIGFLGIAFFYFFRRPPIKQAAAT